MIYLIGAGGHGKVVLETLSLITREVTVLDSDPALEGQKILGRTVAREERVLDGLGAPSRFFVAVGDAQSRKRLIERWEGRGHELVRVVHRFAVVGASAILEPGVLVMAGAVVQAEARIARGVIVNTHATVEHDCNLGEFAHVAPGAQLAGSVDVGEEAWVGIGASVLEGVSIGKRTVVGAGSVVVEDLPSEVVAYGNPCKVVRKIGITR